MYVSIFGDSISTYRDMNPKDYLVYYNTSICMRNSLMRAEDTWWGRVLDEFGYDLLINASYSGSKVSGDNFPAANSYERINALHNEIFPEMILIYLGYNDYGFCVPLGSETSIPDTAFFYSSYTLMLRRLKGIYPAAKIVCGTLMRNYIFYRPDISEKLCTNRGGIPIKEYNNCIRTVCNNEGVMIADLYDTGIKCDTLDGSHGTLRGHEEMGSAWIKCLSDIFSSTM